MVFCRCQKLIDGGESEVYLHALGAAIPRALNLALKVKKFYGEQVSLDTATSTVELTDDFQRISNSNEQRYNSGVYIKLIYNKEPPPAEESNQSEQ